VLQGLLLQQTAGSGQGSSRRALGRAGPAVLIIAVTWIANFLHCKAFGFYEDDWYYFAAAYRYTFMSWFGMLRREVVRFDLGRPVQNISQRVFGYVGAALSSISALYLLAFLLLSLAAVLFYLVLRIRFSTSFSTLASLILVLSPLFTIKQFLNFAFTIGPGFIFLFIAILLFNRHHRLLSVAAATAGLLTYEPLFFVYFAAPLFRRAKFSRRRRTEFLVHLAGWVLVMTFYVAARRYFAETRVNSISSGPAATLGLMASYCLRFTLQSFQCYIYAAYVGLREADWESVFYAAVFFIPALIVAFRLWPQRTGSLSAARRKRWLCTAAAGLLLTALGYCLAYFHLDHQAIFPLSGRATRVSGAASLGSSILVAALLSWAGESQSRFRRVASRVLASVSLTLLFLYAFVVQRDYVADWKYQREFLAQAMLLSPDIHGDSQFVVRTDWIMEPLFPGSLRRRSIGFSRHGLQISFRALFGDTTGPRMFFVYSDEWTKYLALHADHKLYWTQTSFPGGWEISTTEPIVPGHVIVMNEDSHGIVTRGDAPVWIGGEQIVQLPHPAAENYSESKWPFLPRSPLLRQIVPDYVMTGVMSHLAQAPSPPPVRISGGLSLENIAPAGEGAMITKGPPLKIVTATNAGYFASFIPIRQPPGLFGARYVFLRARVLKGCIGIAVVDGKTTIFIQREVRPSTAPVDLYMPLVDPARASNFVFFNAATNGERSEIMIDDAALVTSPE
jgi:hypothetical protein